MTTGWIKEATNQWDATVEPDVGMPKLSAGRLAGYLNCEITGCRLWKANWRNRIYRVTLGDGTEAVAKQPMVSGFCTLKCEYEALEALAALPTVEGVGIPSPIAYVRELDTYLMKLVRGAPVVALMRRRRRPQLLEACQLAGRALGTIHRHWTYDIQNVPVTSLVDDLLGPTLKLSRCQKLALEAATEMLCGEVVPVGQPFLDFKPANVIYDRHRVWIIDPPEQRRSKDILLWDVAVFCRGLRHELWKSIIPLSRVDLVQDAVEQFERAYRQTQPHMLPSRSFRLLTDLLELQRLGQLIALQQSKCRRARLSHLGRRFAVVRSIDAARLWVPVPVLTFQAHRLVESVMHTLRAPGL